MASCFRWVESAWSAGGQWLHSIAHNAQLWNAFWPAVFGAAAGAYIAFLLERRRRKNERIAHELGQCHVLHFMLVHMLQTLENFQAQLFTDFETEHGRARQWHEIGMMDGAPERGPGFAIKDYGFLVDGSERASPAPQLLNKAYTAATGYDAILSQLGRRNQIWQQYEEHRINVAFAVGGAGASETTGLKLIEKRLQELTEWLKEGIAEDIVDLQTLRSIFEAVMRKRYPKRPFIAATPKDAAPSRPGSGDG
jgi:hypothetical protein